MKINNCVDCRFFDKSKRDCSIKDGSPIRKCVIGINKALVDELAEKSAKIRVLEIGCGSWSYLKDFLPGNVEWEGIDVLAVDMFGKKTIATKIGSVGRIPFDDSSFDLVLANQSIEHWFEFGITFEGGLSEISRVLKVGGVFYANAPIHLHGHSWFLKGKLNDIFKIFLPKYWSLDQEFWRKDPTPLAKYQGWKNWLWSDCLGRNYDDASSWEINLIAVKKTFFRLRGWSKVKAVVYGSISSFLPRKAKMVLNYGPFCFIRIMVNKFLKKKKYTANKE